MAEMSWQHWLTFDGLAAADRVTTPVLFVHSDGCVFPDTVRDLAARVRGPVEVVWGNGTQTDFYDQPEQVAFAVDAVDRYLTTIMATGPRSASVTTAEEAADAVVALFHAVDDLDWAAVTASLTSEVAIDYTSLWGGQPDRLDAERLLSAWRELLPGFDATQHLLGPILATSADANTVQVDLTSAATT